MLDLFGRGFVLLRFEGDDPQEPSALLAAARARGVPLELADIRDEAIKALYAGRLVLVRPDGHVAWRGETLPEPQSLLDTIVGA